MAPRSWRVGSTEPEGDFRPRGMAVTRRATAVHRIRRTGRLYIFSSLCGPVLATKTGLRPAESNRPASSLGVRVGKTQLGKNACLLGLHRIRVGITGLVVQALRMQGAMHQQMGVMIF